MYIYFDFNYLKMVRKDSLLMTVLKIFKIAFFLLVSACSADNKDLIQYIHEVKSRKSIPIKAIPVFSDLPGFKFSNEGVRRNPLKPIGIKKNTDRFVLNQKRVRQALEDYYFSRCESNDEGECAR